MYRIDSSGNVGSIPVPAALGTEGYWSWGNPGIPLPATQLDQDWFNMLQESLMALITTAAIPHSKTDYTGLLQAILAVATMTDVGAVNALAVNPPVSLPAASSIALGTCINVIPANTNTSGTPTLTVSGGGAATITDPSGNPIGIGSIVAGWPIKLIKAAGTWILISSTMTPGFAVFSSSGTFTVPGFVTAVKVRLWAPGGGGGASGTTGGTGGGGGGYAEGIASVTPGSTVAVTIGAGGAGGASPSGNGSAGGTSSFGAFMTATGGAGGVAGAQSGGGGGSSSGGAFNMAGSPGSYAFNTASPSGWAGGLGGSSFGSGPAHLSIQVAGAPGVFPGAGGTGGSYTGGASTAGGTGAAGLLLLDW